MAVAVGQCRFNKSLLFGWKIDRVNTRARVCVWAQSSLGLKVSGITFDWMMCVNLNVSVRHLNQVIPVETIEICMRIPSIRSVCFHVFLSFRISYLSKSSNKLYALSIWIIWCQIRLDYLLHVELTQTDREWEKAIFFVWAFFHCLNLFYNNAAVCFSVFHLPFIAFDKIYMRAAFLLFAKGVTVFVSLWMRRVRCLCI